MAKSARLLGLEFGRSAREMNALLKNYGYLEGEPGAYGLTEKGQRYGEDRYHANGYGGYAARSWETRSWNDETAAALRADLEVSPKRRGPRATAVDEVRLAGSTGAGGHSQCDYEPRSDGTTGDYEPEGVYLDPDSDADNSRLSAGVLVAIAGIVAAPHLRPVWETRVKPAALKAWAQLTKSRSAEAPPAESVENSL